MCNEIRIPGIEVMPPKRHDYAPNIVLYWKMNEVAASGVTSNQKYKKFFSAYSSQQIFDKNSVNKILKVNSFAIKSFSKNLSFGVNFKLQVPPLAYKIYTHNISNVRSTTLTEGFNDQLCMMYVACSVLPFIS